MRSHLEYAVQVWNRSLTQDIEVLEKVQKRVFKIPYMLKNSEYDNRLIVWGISRLDERRIRGDLIQIYKIINKIEIVKMLSQNFLQTDSRKGIIWVII